MLEREPYLTLGGQTEPVVCDGWPQRVSAQPFEALTLTGRHEDARMEIEAVLPRVTASERGRLVLLGRIAASAPARARAVAERRDSLHGRRRDPRKRAATSTT